MKRADVDKVLIIGPELMDSLVFLYTDSEIANFTVIDTPVYNETLDEYYRCNPDKRPTVVLIDCWFGIPYIPEGSYIMNWVKKRQ